MCGNNFVQMQNFALTFVEIYEAAVHFLSRLLQVATLPSGLSITLLTLFEETLSHNPSYGLFKIILKYYLTKKDVK